MHMNVFSKIRTANSLKNTTIGDKREEKGHACIFLFFLWYPITKIVIACVDM